MSFFIDSHAHIDYAWTQSRNNQQTDQTESQQDLISFARGFVGRAQASGVRAIVNIGTNRHRTQQSYDLARAFPGAVFTTLGIHPDEAQDMTESELQSLFAEWETLYKEFPQGIVAIGECGLDYFYGPMTQEAKDHQKNLCVQHIQFANRLWLPVVFHAREADTDMQEILRNHTPDHGFVVHCYTAGPELLSAILELGGFIGCTGIVTYPNAESVRQSVLQTPLDRLLLETDAPFLAPQSVRGQKNESAHIPEIAQKVAEIHAVSLAQLRQTVYDNTCRFYKLEWSRFAS